MRWMDEMEESAESQAIILKYLDEASKKQRRTRQEIEYGVRGWKCARSFSGAASG